jgi:hypothetical protein
MLVRRTISLADGTVRSYFALPPDYQEFGHEFRDREDALMRNRNHDYWNSLGPDNSNKRKYGEEGNDVFARQRQQLLQYGNVPAETYRLDNNGGLGEDSRVSKLMRAEQGRFSGLRHNEVDQSALKNAFLHFVKFVNENEGLKKCYLADGKQGPLQCVACRRFDFKETSFILSDISCF